MFLIVISDYKCFESFKLEPLNRQNYLEPQITDWIPLFEPIEPSHEIIQDFLLKLSRDG